MKIFLLLPLLLMPIPQSQSSSAPEDNSPLLILDFKWQKNRQIIEKPLATTMIPAAAMTPKDKAFEREQRINDPMGAKDPKADTVDTRSATIERIMQESRSPGSKTVDGFDHRIRVRSGATKTIVGVFWEYQFIESLNNANVVRRQFICGVKIKPNQDKELQGLSLSNPDAVISVQTLTNKNGKAFLEKAVINRVEYSDGSLWQRKDWNLAEMKAAIEHAFATPWGPDMCRSLESR